MRRGDARAFMDRQLASGLAVRGWLDPAYDTLGADPGVSYMAAMGGSGVLDYAINLAPQPAERLSFPVNSTYQVLQDGTPVAVSQTGNRDHPWRAELSVGVGPVSVTIARTDR